MVNHVGRYTLYRWPDGKRSLSLECENTSIWGQAPTLAYGWQCFFVSRFPDKVKYSYKKNPTENRLFPYEVDVEKNVFL